MDAKRVLEMVNDFPEWKGDVYRLAMSVMQETKESCAQMADAAEQPDLAAQMRA